MIEFKTATIEKEFFSDLVRSDLKIMVLMIAVYIEALYAKPTVITGIFPEPGIARISPTHKEGRAIDIRSRNMPAEKIAKWANSRFSTGVKKPDGSPMLACYYHNSGYGYHFHCQVAKRPLLVVAPHNMLLVPPVAVEAIANA